MSKAFPYKNKNLLLDRFYLEVAKGNIKGHSIERILCNTLPAAATTKRVLGATLTPAGLQWPSWTAKMTAVSSVATDALGNTGINTIKAEGLNIDYLPVTDTINMNGLTTVSGTTNFIRVNKAYPTNIGSSHFGGGIITINLVPGTTIGFMRNTLLWETGAFGGFTIPANKQGYILRAGFNAGPEMNGTYSILTRPSGGVFSESLTNSIAGHAFYSKLSAPIIVDEKSDIMIAGNLTAVSAAYTEEVCAYYELLLVDKYTY